MSLAKIGYARTFLRLLSNGLPRLQSAIPPAEPGHNLATDVSSGRPLVPKPKPSDPRPVRFAMSNLNPDVMSNWELERLRIVPKLATFYGGNPVHEDNMNQLNALVRKYKNLPTRVLDEKELKAYKFVSLEDYRKRAQSGTRLKIGHHKELLELLNRLRSIEPELMPKEVIEVLQKYSSALEDKKQVVQTAIKTLDKYGRANTVGKRKRAVANISMVKGEGLVLVNGKSFLEYFKRDIDRSKIGYPFKVVSQEGQYNVFITTEGGGISGQAEAAMYGISKALVVFNPLFKSRLRLAGLMTRDARKVERKKPGKVKARKSPTWVKR